MPEPSARALAGVVLELLGALLAEQLGMSAQTDREPHEALFARVCTFVEARLTDPELSPREIANAHHVSLRSLQVLFQRKGTTVAKWIRQRRLERCRLDLLDPTLERLPVHAIARRWGFVNDSHFNRAFRTELGISPAAYRRNQLLISGH
jgi:AraC-like DNA-binding protein